MVTSSEFRAFVEQQRRAHADQADVDWNKRRDQWLAHINDLYQHVRDYLSEYITEGVIGFRFEDLEINEDRIGVYRTRRMVVEIGDKTVILTPVGTNIVGAHGRVDLDGSAGKIRLVLVNSSLSSGPPKVRILKPKEKAPKQTSMEDAVFVWKISTPPPRVQLSDFSRENFYDAILEVTNG